MQDSSYMSIQFEALQQAHSDLSAVHGSIQDAVAELEANLERNLDQWSGAAKEAYGPIKAQWHAAMENMAMVLGKAHQHLANTAELYASAEQQNVGIWNL